MYYLSFELSQNIFIPAPQQQPIARLQPLRRYTEFGQEDTKKYRNTKIIAVFVRLIVCFENIRRRQPLA